MVRPGGDRLHHRQRAGQARSAIPEGRRRLAAGIQESARGAGERGEGGGGGEEGGGEKIVGWAKAPLGAVPTIVNPNAELIGGHAGGRVRVHRLCPPYKSTNRSPLLPLFWHCDVPQISFRTCPSASRQPTVNGFSRESCS